MPRNGWMSLRPSKLFAQRPAFAMASLQASYGIPNATRCPPKASPHVRSIMNTTDAKRILETALICSQQPLQLREMGVLFDGAMGPDSIKALLDELQDDWRQRGVELARVATGWRMQSRPEMRTYLDRLHPEKPPRYTRAALETLAVVAYRQPVTRGDMEDIRGVTINSQLLRQLEERGWVEVIGHREAAGRPALYATTRQFLDDLGIESLEQLPVLDHLARPGADALDLLEHGSSGEAPQGQTELAIDPAEGPALTSAIAETETNGTTT